MEGFMTEGSGAGNGDHIGKWTLNADAQHIDSENRHENAHILEVRTMMGKSVVDLVETIGTAAQNEEIPAGTKIELDLPNAANGTRVALKITLPGDMRFVKQPIEGLRSAAHNNEFPLVAEDLAGSGSVAGQVDQLNQILSQFYWERSREGGLNSSDFGHPR